MVRAYEKYGWVVYLGLGTLWLLVGLAQAFFPDGLLTTDTQILLGISWSELQISNPEGTELVRYYVGEMGLLKMSWSFLVLAITLTGLRKGEKWAWYILWFVPWVLVSSFFFWVSWFGRIDEALRWIPIITLSIVGLLLPYRRFFPESHFQRILVRIKGQT